MKKLIAAILCLAMLFSTQALACNQADATVSQSVFIRVIADFFERFISVFEGSTNEKSDIVYTAETGRLFKKNEHFKSSHASTIVKMSDGRLMSAYFAGTGEAMTMCESGSVFMKTAHGTSPHRFPQKTRWLTGTLCL